MELTERDIPEVLEGGKIGANVVIILQSQKLIAKQHKFWVDVKSIFNVIMEFYPVKFFLGLFVSILQLFNLFRTTICNTRQFLKSEEKEYFFA